MQKHVPNEFCGGTPNWRLKLIDIVAKLVGVLVHVEGFPLGSRRNLRANVDV